MNYFQNNDEGGSAFLRTLDKRIDKNEFKLMEEFAGFTDPNSYISVNKFEQALQSLQFPADNCYEYQWALNESDFTSIRGLSIWMQLFLASLYVYCDKRKQWSILASSDYHLLVLTLAREQQNGAELGEMYCSFLEWLESHVKPDTGFNDYYCLLTWLMMHRIKNTLDHPNALKVLSSLERRRYSPGDIEELTVSEAGIEPWLDLHLELPCSPETEAIFERIIVGV